MHTPSDSCKAPSGWCCYSAKRRLAKGRAAATRCAAHAKFDRLRTLSLKELCQVPAHETDTTVTTEAGLKIDATEIDATRISFQQGHCISVAVKAEAVLRCCQGFTLAARPQASHCLRSIML